MALKRANMVKVATSADLSLEAKAGESLIVRDVRIYNPASNYVTLSVDRKSVGYFRVGGVRGSHLPFFAGKFRHSHDWTTGSTAAADQTSFAGIEDAEAAEVAAKMIGGLTVDTTYYDVGAYHDFFSADQRTLLGLLSGLGHFSGYPVPEGTTFTISGASQSGCYQLVDYAVYDAADVRPDLPNGPEGSEYLHVNYGDSGGNINANGDTLLDESNNPAEFPAFPFGATVPAGYEADLIGILGSPVAPSANDGTDSIYTSYLKLIHERETLFDDDKNGLLMIAPFTTALAAGDMVGEGYSVVGDYSTLDRNMPFLLAEPLTFRSGEELAINLTTVQGGSGQNLSAALQEVAVILIMRRA